MEVKKSEKANLENKVFLFREIGFVVVLAFVLFAFEFGIRESNTATLLTGQITEDETEMVEVTREEQPPEPEQPKPELPEPPPSDQIEETEDETEDQSDQVEGQNDDQNMNIPDAPMFEEPTEENEHVHVKVEKMPGFPGGMGALISFIGKNLVYPQDAAELGLEGTVVVRFVVNRQGKAVKPEIIKSVNPMLDKAAMDVIAKLPAFEPGEQAGEKVPVYFNLPVQFKLVGAR